MRNHRSFLQVVGLGSVGALLALIAAQSVWAGSTGQLCIKEKIGGNPPCTANDVRISQLITANGGPLVCTPGDIINVTLVATIESSPARYDIGLWLNETGGSALSDPGGTCYRDYLTPRSANNFGCLAMSPGPYFNGETASPQDMCGDVPANNGAILCGAPTAPCSNGGGTCVFTTYTFNATFECADSNDDGMADVGTCTSWDNNTQNDCTNELDTDPGTGSKCNCDAISIGNVFIDPCESANCDDGVSCTVDTCDSSSGSAVCINTPVDALCNDGDFCNGVETCDALGDCQAGVAPVCNDGVDCTDDFCDEVLDQCDATPNNSNCSDGQFCNGTEICDPALNCLAGSPPDCDDGVDCTADACNELTDQCDNTGNNALCNDGQFCNGVETCDVLNDCQAGAAPDCDDAVACTIDTCNEVSDLCVNAPNGASCDNGLFCDGVEICDPGSGCQSGTPPDCDDGVTCTNDSCNEAADDCDNVADNSNCSDGLFCTGVEICNVLTDCEAGTDPCTGILCDESGDQCVGCLVDANCDNGVFCDGAETCDTNTGSCVAGTPVVCDDGVGCTLDSCNESTNQCDNVANNGLCTDGLFCNGIETCDALNDCQAGAPPDCDDAVACTDDSCNEATDQCDNVANNANCDNGSFCDGTETCDPLGDCQAGAPPNCNDGVSCTADSCSIGLNACLNAPNDALCSNGQFCDGDETCDVLNDCQAGPAPDCTDAVACTVDACNELLDSCTNTPNAAACSDGAFCNGVEICDLLAGCQAGVAPVCDDAVGCTLDSCDEVNDTCVNSPDNALCNNGQYCDGVEVCDAIGDCQSGTPPNCDDSFACTLDECDEIDDVCTNDDVGCFCGDAEIGPGETCDPPGTAPGSEICDNLIDDDADGAIDCEDDDCPAFCEHDPGIPCVRHRDCRELVPGWPPKTSCIGAATGCDSNCQAVLACNAMGPDPSTIRFSNTGGPDMFKMHASFVPQTEMYPEGEEFSFLLTNASGLVYRAELEPGDLQARGRYYRFKDIGARHGAPLRDGIYKASLKRRVKHGRVNYSFKLQIYGDFSAATEALMMTQIKVANDGTMIVEEWTPTSRGWKLDQSVF